MRASPMLTMSPMTYTLHLVAMIDTSDTKNMVYRSSSITAMDTGHTGATSRAHGCYVVVSADSNQ